MQNDEGLKWTKTYICCNFDRLKLSLLQILETKEVDHESCDYWVIILISVVAIIFFQKLF